MVMVMLLLLLLLADSHRATRAPSSTSELIMKKMKRKIKMMKTKMMKRTRKMKK